MTNQTEAFHGAKLLLFLGEQLVVLERDHTPGIPWPGYLDFPGGGREPGESPVECALRETYEEVGLRLGKDKATFVHQRMGQSGVSVFFAAHLPAAAEKDIVFGDEGAGWSLMLPEAFVAHPKAIPHFAQILADYIKKRRVQHS